MSEIKKTTVCVQGMHCASCDILVKNKFKEVSNVQEVKANHKTQEVEILYTGHLVKAELENRINEIG